MSLNPLSGRRKLFALVGLLAGAGAAVARRTGAGRLLGLGSSSTDQADATGPHSPEPSNYDIAGPAANTATAVPVPEAYDPETLDEDAEIAAAAAEARNIGGGPIEYSGADGPYEPADDAERPLAEAGEGYSEGMDLAEAELIEAAEPSDTASPYQHSIEDAIEAQDDPTAGERIEALQSSGEQLLDPDQPGDDLGSSATGSTREPDRDDAGTGGWSEPLDRP